MVPEFTFCTASVSATPFCEAAGPQLEHSGGHDARPFGFCRAVADQVWPDTPSTILYEDDV